MHHTHITPDIFWTLAETLYEISPIRKNGSATKIVGFSSYSDRNLETLDCQIIDNQERRVRS